MLFHVTTVKWRVELTPRAEKKLDRWLKENKYGTFFELEYIPPGQLSLTQLIHYCKSHKIPFRISEKTANPVELLAEIVREDLEARN